MLVLLLMCVYVWPSGTRAETSSRVTGKEGFEADGIQGLKALGVRELSYRLAFLANNVAPTNPRVRRTRLRVLHGFPPKPWMFTSPILV